MPSQVTNINTWKASNGEEIHGYLWQSIRLLAYDTGSLAGNRKALIDPNLGEDHVMRVCEPAWFLAPQSRDDCAHAAGHGFFYYYMDVGRAVSSCWSDKIVDKTPCGSKPAGTCYEKDAPCTKLPPTDPGYCVYDPTCWIRDCGDKFDQDTDVNTRQGGLNSKDLLKWRWLCATGVYHAAGNTLSVEVLHELGRIGSGAHEFLCKRSHLWGDDTPYFDRCAAGLGMKETEGRLERVTDGTCKPRKSDDGSVMAPAAWESHWLREYGQTMQLSCNPAKYFALANDNCPMAYKPVFPCDPNRKDYQFCASGYHDLCDAHNSIRTIFLCGEDENVDGEWEVTPRAGVNGVKYGIHWKMGDPVGVWGGRSCYEFLSKTPAAATLAALPAPCARIAAFAL